MRPESLAELAAAMSELAADPGRRAELGARGREFAVRRLSKEAALGRLEAAILG